MSEVDTAAVSQSTTGDRRPSVDQPGRGRRPPSAVWSCGGGRQRQLQVVHAYGRGGRAVAGGKFRDRTMPWTAVSVSDLPNPAGATSSPDACIGQIAHSAPAHRFGGGYPLNATAS